jgi:hypothetical protein
LRQKPGDLEDIKHLACWDGATGESVDISDGRMLLINCQAIGEKDPGVLKVIAKGDDGKLYILRYLNSRAEREIQKAVKGTQENQLTEEELKRKMERQRKYGYSNKEVAVKECQTQIDQKIREIIGTRDELHEALAHLQFYQAREEYVNGSSNIPLGNVTSSILESYWEKRNHILHHWIDKSSNENSIRELETLLSKKNVFVQEREIIYETMSRYNNCCPSDSYPLTYIILDPIDHLLSIKNYTLSLKAKLTMRGQYVSNYKSYQQYSNTKHWSSWFHFSSSYNSNTPFEPSDIPKSLLELTQEIDVEKGFTKYIDELEAQMEPNMKPLMLLMSKYWVLTGKKHPLLDEFF